MLGRSCHLISLSRCRRQTTKELRRQFQEADKDGSGEIDATEVASGKNWVRVEAVVLLFCFLMASFC